MDFQSVSKTLDGADHTLGHQIKRFSLRTMQLVGAKSSLIRRPFLRKAVLNGFISGVFAIIILIGLWHLFSDFNPEVVAKMSANKEIVDHQIKLFSILFTSVLVSGIVISVCSTYFALNKYIWINSEKLY